MTDTPVNFTENAARKIAEAVKRVLGTPTDQTGATVKNRPPADRFFFAMIDGSVTSGGSGSQGRYYDWHEVYPRRNGGVTLQWNPVPTPTDSPPGPGRKSTQESNYGWAYEVSGAPHLGGWTNQFLPFPVAIGTVVMMRHDLVYNEAGTGPPYQSLFTFNRVPDGYNCVVTLTATETQGGTYTGYICFFTNVRTSDPVQGISPVGGFTPGSAFPSSTGIGAPLLNKCLVLNLDEAGASSHLLATSGGYWMGQIVTNTSESPTRPVVVINGNSGRLGSFPVSGPPGDGDSWSAASGWSSSGGQCYAYLDVVTSVVTSGGTTTVKRRTLTLDVLGRVINISSVF